jgi:hypothetical protein
VYRVFELDENGRVSRPAMNLQAADDIDALARARQLVGQRDLEVWQDTRLVGTATAERKTLRDQE